MKVQYHLLVSGCVAGGVYSLSRSWPAAFTSFAAGVVIDLDHLFDYLREHRRAAGIGHFFTTWHNGDLQRAVLALHSWELVMALAVANILAPGYPVLAGLLVGLGHHLALDQVAYRPHPLAYFFLWRWRNGFGLKESFGRGLSKNME